jgi:hypothetical protein
MSLYENYRLGNPGKGERITYMHLMLPILQPGEPSNRLGLFVADHIFSFPLFLLLLLFCFLFDR